MALLRLLALSSLVMISFISAPGCGKPPAPPPEVGKVPDEFVPPLIDIGVTMDAADKIAAAGTVELKK